MSMRIWFIVGFIALLYFLKAPNVVHFVNGILDYIATNWNFLIDVMMNVRDRHPWVWIALPFILLVLMSGRD